MTAAPAPQAPDPEEIARAGLCWYDPRAPYYVQPDGIDIEFREPRETGCGCDPCFSGKDKIASALLALSASHRALAPREEAAAEVCRLIVKWADTPLGQAGMGDNLDRAVPKARAFLAARPAP